MKLSSFKTAIKVAANSVVDKLDKLESLKDVAQDLLIKPYIVVLEDGKTLEVHTMKELLDAVNYNSKDITILEKRED